MSRAFTKEPDGSEPLEVMERQISTDRNFVTESGLKLIDGEIERLHKLVNSSSEQEIDMAQYLRDLRYWQARRASAEIITPQDVEKVTFGLHVTLHSEHGKQIIRIVGQDEADPQKGLLSYTSPLARKLIGKEIGDEVSFNNNVFEITDIDVG